MDADKRIFELRFNGLYGQPEVVALTDGELKNPKEILPVVPQTELQRVQGLLEEAIRHLSFAVFDRNGVTPEQFIQSKKEAVSFLEKVRGGK